MNQIVDWVGNALKVIFEAIQNLWIQVTVEIMAAFIGGGILMKHSTLIKNFVKKYLIGPAKFVFFVSPWLILRLVGRKFWLIWLVLRPILGYLSTFLHDYFFNMDEPVATAKTIEKQRINTLSDRLQNNDLLTRDSMKAYFEYNMAHASRSGKLYIFDETSHKRLFNFDLLFKKPKKALRRLSKALKISPGVLARHINAFIDLYHISINLENEIFYHARSTGLLNNAIGRNNAYIPTVEYMHDFEIGTTKKNIVKALKSAREVLFNLTGYKKTKDECVEEIKDLADENEAAKELLECWAKLEGFWSQFWNRLDWGSFSVVSANKCLNFIYDNLAVFAAFTFEKMQKNLSTLILEIDPNRTILVKYFEECGWEFKENLLIMTKAGNTLHYICDARNGESYKDGCAPRIDITAIAHDFFGETSPVKEKIIVRILKGFLLDKVAKYDEALDKLGELLNDGGYSKLHRTYLADKFRDEGLDENGGQDERHFVNTKVNQSILYCADEKYKGYIGKTKINYDIEAYLKFAKEQKTKIESDEKTKTAQEWIRWIEDYRDCPVDIARLTDALIDNISRKAVRNFLLEKYDYSVLCFPAFSALHHDTGYEINSIADDLANPGITEEEVIQDIEQHLLAKYNAVTPVLKKKFVEELFECLTKHEIKVVAQNEELLKQIEKFLSIPVTIAYSDNVNDFIFNIRKYLEENDFIYSRESRNYRYCSGFLGADINWLWKFGAAWPDLEEDICMVAIAKYPKLENHNSTNLVCKEILDLYPEEAEEVEEAEEGCENEFEEDYEDEFKEKYEEYPEENDAEEIIEKGGDEDTEDSWDNETWVKCEKEDPLAPIIKDATRTKI